MENKSKEDINMMYYFVAFIGLMLQLAFIGWTLSDIRNELRKIRKHLRGEKIEED